MIVAIVGIVVSVIIAIIIAHYTGNGLDILRALPPVTLAVFMVFSLIPLKKTIDSDIFISEKQGLIGYIEGGKVQTAKLDVSEIIEKDNVEKPVLKQSGIGPIGGEKRYTFIVPKGSVVLSDTLTVPEKEEALVPLTFGNIKGNYFLAVDSTGQYVYYSVREGNGNAIKRCPRSQAEIVEQESANPNVTYAKIVTGIDPMFEKFVNSLGRGMDGSSYLEPGRKFIFTIPPGSIIRDCDINLKENETVEP